MPVMVSFALAVYSPNAAEIFTVLSTSDEGFLRMSETEFDIVRGTLSMSGITVRNGEGSIRAR